MTYNPSIPQPTDKFSISQPQILANFSQLSTIFATNHVSLTDATVADRGKHSYVWLKEQTIDPVTGANDGVIYSKSLAGVTVPYWQRGAGTAYTILGTTIPSKTANGYSTLPGELIIQWGTVKVTNGTSAAINFPVAFGAAPYSITCNFIRSSTSTVTALYIKDGTVTATQFKTLSVGTSGSHDIYWMAIGPER